MTEAISRLWTTDNIVLMHQFLVPASGLTNPDKLFFQHMIILMKIQFNFCKKYSACLMLDVLLMPIFLPIFCFSLTRAGHLREWTLRECAVFNNWKCFMNKTLSGHLQELKTKQKSSWVIPKVVAVACRSGRLICFSSQSHSSIRVLQRWL